MKGIRYVTDEHNKKVAVQIDLKTLEKYEEQLEDLLDIIIAESRKDEESVSLEEVMKQIGYTGKK